MNWREKKSRKIHTEHRNKIRKEIRFLTKRQLKRRIIRLEMVRLSIHMPSFADVDVL